MSKLEWERVDMGTQVGQASEGTIKTADGMMPPSAVLTGQRLYGAHISSGELLTHSVRPDLFTLQAQSSSPISIKTPILSTHIAQPCITAPLFNCFSFIMTYDHLPGPNISLIL